MIGDRKVCFPVTVQIAGDDIRRIRSDRIGHSRGEGAVPVADEYGYGVCARVRNDHVASSVTVEIAGRDGGGGGEAAEADRRRCERPAVRPGVNRRRIADAVVVGDDLSAARD